MQDPTGPWVVSWYKETGRLGVPDENVVMAAHVDYWDVGPAVFYNIRVLAEGDTVDVTGDDGNVYRYAVEWQKLFDADNAPIQDIVGRPNETALTLITCGGQFDYPNGHYISRTVVRCKFAEKVAPPRNQSDRLDRSRQALRLPASLCSARRPSPGFRGTPMVICVMLREGFIRSRTHSVSQ